MPPAVSVIIPHFNDLENLDRCLTALSAQTYSQPFEIIVGDNCSPQGEAAVADVIGGRAKLVQVRERGAGPARNGAFASASGEILAFIDSDCVPSPEWIAEGVKALNHYDFVGGHVTVSVDDEERVTPAEAFERLFAFDFETYINKKGFTGSGNLFVPRKVFEHVGGFSNGVSEDVEWSRRARSQGFRLGYAPTAVIAHPGRRNWRELRDKWLRINRETYKLMRQARFGRAKWLARTIALPASALAHTPRVLTSERLKSRRERMGALVTLYRLRLWRLQDGLRLLASRH